MIRKLFVLFSFGIFSFVIYGQDSLAYNSKLQMRFLGGANIPITNLFQGKETDYMFQYDDNSYYWQLFSISYFFHKHWGLEFNYQAVSSKGIRKRNDDFIANMQLQHGDNYYVNAGVWDTYDDFNYFSGDFQRGYLGAIYRFETDKFYIYPKFAVGVITFHTGWGSANLKEKNSNIKYNINYSSNKKTDDYFALAPSVSFGYKISKRFYLNADILLSYHKTNILFEKNQTNLYTNERTMEYFDYRKDILTLSLGVGLIFVLL